MVYGYLDNGQDCVRMLSFAHELYVRQVGGMVNAWASSWGDWDRRSWLMYANVWRSGGLRCDVGHGPWEKRKTEDAHYSNRLAASKSFSNNREQLSSRVKTSLRSPASRRRDI
jgi:hypothetical protein